MLEWQHSGDGAPDLGLAAKLSSLSETVVYGCGMGQLVVDEEQFAGMLAEVRPHLSELQWRLLLGAQARSLGRGGVKRVAALAGGSSGHGGPGSAGAGGWS